MKISIEASFMTMPPFGFTARMPSDDFYSPPYLIAEAMINRVDRLNVAMPDGCDDAMLEDICARTSKISGEPIITYREAKILRDLGFQLLALDELGQVKPPLDNTEPDNPFKPEHHSINVLIKATDPHF